MFRPQRGSGWGAGGGGERDGRTLVSTVPLPQTGGERKRTGQRFQGGSAVAAQAGRAEKEPDAIPIPDKDIKKKPQKEASASKQKPEAATGRRSHNVVAFGQGGPVAVRTERSARQARRADSASPAAAAILASQYAWYVRVVQQKVSENWLKYEVDPRITDRAAGVRHL
jgi:hypothetical protein